MRIRNAYEKEILIQESWRYSCQTFNRDNLADTRKEICYFSQWNCRFRVENIGRKVNQEILEVVTGIGGGFSFRMRWKINSRGTKSRAKVKLVSFFFLPSPPCLVSMRLSEINRKSIVEVSLMNGLYITTYVLSDWRFVGLMGKVWPDSLAKCVSESETIFYGRHC